MPAGRARGQRAPPILRAPVPAPKFARPLVPPLHSPVLMRVPSLLAALALAAPALGAQGAPAPRASAIDSATRGLDHRDGFLPMDLDLKKGRILLELPHDSTRFLFVVQEATGLGSNPLGFDRGGDGASQVTRVQRAGDVALVVFENWSYRASAGGAEARSVAESFAPSVVAALPILAEDKGRLLVDATSLFQQDWLNVGIRLRQSNEGSYALARERSFINVSYTKDFPLNTEIDLAQTFAAQGAPGNTVQQVVPDGQAFTLRVHFSLVQLPDDQYRPRAEDPRVGYFFIDFKDFSAPVGARLEQRWITRFRLRRTDPNDPNSAIANPIVYYVDRGIPEPVRSATVAGAKFWEEAFDRAGLKGGFVVKDLPEGADPMDMRYNMVLWLDRNERGWSFGGPTTDPRTGETLKGVAHMDSHRNRTAYNLYAALLGAAPSPMDTHFVLGRVRQVTAHEIGHSLGLAHNYIASTYDHGSVMDYPAPTVLLDANGNVDVSHAYAMGPGAYDVWAIHWGYGIFPEASERDSLKAIIADGLKKGYLYLTDQDARPPYASDPRTNLWDDAANADLFLRRQMDVRAAAMKRFGLANLRDGEAIALLHDRFVPLYLFHRFGINAALRTIGGLEYAYAEKGDGQTATHLIPASRQRASLALLMEALSPAQLAIPDTVLALLSPAPPGYAGGVEDFQSRTRPAFDELGAVSVLAHLVIDGVLQKDRATRVAQFAARMKDPLTLAELSDSLARATGITGPRMDARAERLRKVTRRALVDRMLQLAADPSAAAGVRAIANFELKAWRAIAAKRAAEGSVEDRAHWALIASDIAHWFEEGTAPVLTAPLTPPPGDPFGDDGDY